MTRIPFKTALLALAALATGFAVAGPASADERRITVGTAGVTGVYYPAGGAICRLVNRGRKDHGLRCAVESTGGSINNLESLRKRDLDLGVVQSDLLYHAYKGDDIFIDVGADKNLRILFFLHAEPFTVVARRDARIHTFDDLKGKRVDIGAPGSGMRATMEELMRHKGWTAASFAKIADIRAEEQTQALCSGKIDAMVYAGGHPNGAIQQVTSACPTRLVDVSGPAIDAMLREKPFLDRATIPGGMYAGNARDVKTFGVRAALVASSHLSADAVYRITAAVFDNLDDFKTLHPVFATLDAQKMARESDLAPHHPGALRYYREKGIRPSR